MTSDRPARIVLVEDNPGDVFLLSHALDLQGTSYQLDVMEDGEQALRFVREYRLRPSESRPCLLVLDIHLPRHNGLVVLRAIRQNPALSNVPVVALTGAISAGEEAETRRLGVRLYRQKPLDPRSLYLLGEEIVSICNEDHGEVLVDDEGFEPSTPALRTRCSPN